MAVWNTRAQQSDEYSTDRRQERGLRREVLGFKFYVLESTYFYFIVTPAHTPRAQGPGSRNVFKYVVPG